MKVVLLEGLGVSDQVIQQHARKLEAMGHTFVAYPKNADPQVQAEQSRDADVIMLANMPLSPAVLEEAKSLKFIDVAFTGVDHIPMAEAKRLGIAVSNASGYATQAVAELCVSFMIQLLRNVGKTEERCRSGGTKDGLVGNLLCGKTVGIVGAGAIGKKVAALVSAFGANVIYYDIIRMTEQEEQYGYRFVDMDTLLSESDIFTIHCPLNETTRGLIGEREFARMKPSCMLINTARGPIVDEDALVHALTTGKIATAGLDTYEKEPLPKDHPLLTLDNVVASAHAGGNTRDNHINMVNYVYSNIVKFDRGLPLNTEQDIVNGEYLKK